MNYWICIVNRENWEIVKETNIWGVSDRNKNTISEVIKGDMLVFYVIEEMIFTGIYEATSEVYNDTSILFKPSDKNKIENFPYRINIKPIQIAITPIKMKSIISELEFIQNKKHWGGYFFGKAMRMLSKNDYLLLNQKIA